MEGLWKHGLSVFTSQFIQALEWKLLIFKESEGKIWRFLEV